MAQAAAFVCGGGRPDALADTRVRSSWSICITVASATCTSTSRSAVLGATRAIRCMRTGTAVSDHRIVVLQRLAAARSAGEGSTHPSGIGRHHRHRAKHRATVGRRGTQQHAALALHPMPPVRLGLPRFCDRLGRCRGCSRAAEVRQPRCRRSAMTTCAATCGDGNRRRWLRGAQHHRSCGCPGPGSVARSGDARRPAGSHGETGVPARVPARITPGGGSQRAAQFGRATRLAEPRPRRRQGAELEFRLASAVPPAPAAARRRSRFRTTPPAGAAG